MFPTIAVAISALETRIGDTGRGFRGGKPPRRLFTTKKLRGVDYEQAFKVGAFHEEKTLMYLSTFFCLLDLVKCIYYSCTHSHSTTRA